MSLFISPISTSPILEVVGFAPYFLPKLDTLFTFLINNMHEIEALFTLIYIHPCCLYDYFEDKENGLSIKDLPIFIKGLFPLLNVSMPFFEVPRLANHQKHCTFQVFPAI